MVWYESQESLSTFVLGIGVLVTIGPMIFPPQVVEFCRSDVFALFMCGVIVWFGNHCTLSTTILMLSLVTAYTFLSTMRDSRETFCPYNILPRSTEMASPVDPDASTPPPRCNYSIHPDLEFSENKEVLPTPCEWLGPESSMAPSLEAYEGNNVHSGGADLNASFPSE